MVQVLVTLTQPQVAWFGLWPRLIIIWCDGDFFLGNVEYPIGGNHQCKCGACMVIREKLRQEMWCT
jgi:hypothetical protein